MSDITEWPVIKIVFRNHFWIWVSVLGVMRGDGFEADKTVMSISVSEVVGITFFL